MFNTESYNQQFTKLYAIFKAKLSSPIGPRYNASTDEELNNIYFQMEEEDNFEGMKALHDAWRSAQKGMSVADGLVDLREVHITIPEDVIGLNTLDSMLAEDRENRESPQDNLFETIMSAIEDYIEETCNAEQLMIKINLAINNYERQ